MLNKGLTELLYIQSCSFCLGNESCEDCDYQNNYCFMSCSLFDGAFAALPCGPLNIPNKAQDAHLFNCDDCEHNCILKHTRTVHECFYTDIMNKIGATCKKSRN